MINIVVNQMYNLREELQRPLNSADKCLFAKIIVDIFPLLKDPDSELGYVNTQ